jgi:outer membrane protein OmpA-like peptidoglycan-associated protein
MINSAGWESHPALSPGGDTLYFASNRLGGFGMSDIYFSVRDDRGNWQKAKNLGPVINTRLSEVSPFVHHRYDVLYYSSDGMPVGFGDFDIYLSRSESARRGEPVNAGPLVNGPGSDYYFTLDAASSEIFYSRPSVDGATGLDLWSVPLPMEAHPLADILLTGKIFREDGSAANGIAYVFDLDQHIQVAPRFLSVNGTFNFNLIRNRRYLVVVEGEGFRKLEEKIFLDGAKDYERTVTDEIPLIAFASIEFEPGRAEILPAMVSDLQKLGRLLSEHPDWKLKISGHADAAGEAAAHQELSQKRADAIRNFLMAEHHISEQRILAIGYGSTEPLIPLENTDSDRKINRRVEFEIYK